MSGGLSYNVNGGGLSENLGLGLYGMPIDPITGEGPMAIDTSTFSGPRTSGGGVRNAGQFWKAWKEIYSSTLSDENLRLIDNDDLPVVDDRWVEQLPQHGDFMHDILEHHHVNGGVDATPMPRTLHRLQGNYRFWH